MRFAIATLCEVVIVLIIVENAINLPFAKGTGLFSDL
jgi:hypothetical protein